MAHSQVGKNMAKIIIGPIILFIIKGERTKSIGVDSVKSVATPNGRFKRQ